MTLHPEILWAQRSSDVQAGKNVVYLTVNLPDINGSTLKYELTSSKISFKARTGNAKKGVEEKDYAFDMELFGEVIPEESKRHLNSRRFSVILRKKEKKLEYWPRLPKAEQKSDFIKVDFDKWVDEDEQDGAGVSENKDLDIGGMPKLGGLGEMMAQMGVGRADLSGSSADVDSDSDDDGRPPPLEDYM
ncbi:HSP20-like chaperone [Thelephora terrestris]|uniref:HSP20-like chaperone n=1 Tax=Thelephora terrestris TaxID=56493 RepID=A0A9P6HG38_9AGAM|nr:HSP20-like chaperone [Thelephora terrestris]